MKRLRSLLAVVVAVFALTSCTGDKNGACEPCSNADDCEAGLTCMVFEDAQGQPRNLCGDANPDMICP